MTRSPGTFRGSFALVALVIALGAAGRRPALTRAIAVPDPRGSRS